MATQHPVRAQLRKRDPADLTSMDTGRNLVLDLAMPTVRNWPAQSHTSWNNRRWIAWRWSRSAVNLTVVTGQLHLPNRHEIGLNHMQLEPA